MRIKRITGKSHCFKYNCATRHVIAHFDIYFQRATGVYVTHTAPPHTNGKKTAEKGSVSTLSPSESLMTKRGRLI